GTPITGGQGPDGGQGGTGDAGTGGTPGTGGQGGSGDAGTGGTPGTGGQGGSGDSGTGGGSEDSNSQVDRGVAGDIANVAGNVKKYVLGFGDTVLQGATAQYAGYTINELASGNYKITGQSSINNQFFNHFYDKFKKYELNDRNAYLPTNGANPRFNRVDAFIDSKKIADITSPKTFINSALKSAKSSVNKGFNLFSKDFYGKSNLMKLNGPVNLALSSFNSIYDYSAGGKSSIGLASTDFAADLTTDVAIGVGTTALSTIGASMAAGAIGGSVVPGLGTIVGAAAGLLVGLTVTLLLETGPGKAVKKAVRDGVKFVYDGAVSGVKAAGKGIADGAKGLFDGAKSLFGF
ncbi:MAG: hypothetical protein R3267_04610, partial [Paenisporosarcina sp.]|nr:hypothetical protein [Paenisporosarcina sp.]